MTLEPVQYLLGALSGGLVGFTLGLVGGGGSILAVPLMVYLVGVPSPHMAIGTSALAVAVNAAAGLMNHARNGTVKWRCALMYAGAGIAGAFAGSTVGKAFDGQKLLFLFAIVMVVVGVLMLRGRGDIGNPGAECNREKAPKVLGYGLGTGVFSGFFGIGGGFLIVPGLVASTGMPILNAIGSSLVAVTAFGLTTALNYAFSGLIDWPLAGIFVVGGLVGSFGGALAAKKLSGTTGLLTTVFSVLIFIVAAYMLWKSAGAFFGTTAMFDHLDPVILARIQFAFTVSFHFIFPSFSIGLASYLAVLEGLWLKTCKSVYLDLFKYWLKIFAVVFAMGVVSGIVMSYQFGTNWSVFSVKTGPVLGPLMAYEVLTAFFLEAGFLGVMLFGMSKVGRKLHFAATCMVALGTFISATWILSVNSWMQTPTGFDINAAGQFVPAGSWLDIIFNPSFPFRLLHTLIASYLTTSLVVGAVGAWHLLKDRTNPYARKMFSMAMWMAAIVAPIQIFAGDLHGLNTLEHQPAKVMAMEGHYQSHPDGAPLILFGIPNSAEKRIDYAIEIPKASSLILKHDPNAPLAGLDTIPDDREPPVAIVFWSFRVMVGLGFAMLGLGVISLVARARRSLYDWPLLHRLAILMGPTGFVAVIAGWITTEVGRQPYTVYGQLLTGQSHSPLAAPAVAASLIAFVIVYFAVFGAGVWYLLKLMGHTPHAHETEPPQKPIRSAGITPAPALDGAPRPAE